MGFGFKLGISPDFCDGKLTEDISKSCKNMHSLCFIIICRECPRQCIKPKHQKLKGNIPNLKGFVYGK